MHPRKPRPGAHPRAHRSNSPYAQRPESDERSNSGAQPQSHPHTQGHDEGHGKGHGHGRTPSHGHSQSQSQSRSHGHSTSHDRGHGRHHGAAHSDAPARSHDRSHGHSQSQSQSHGHAHAHAAPKADVPQAAPAAETPLASEFRALHLEPVLLRAVEEEGYLTPTPIQAQAIPPGLAGKDVLGCAQTGTGKTAAFALPILQRLFLGGAQKHHRGAARPRALILAPTRELAAQIGESFAVYGRHTGLRHAVVFGGASAYHQLRALERGVDVLVATPGRLIDFMEQRAVDLGGVGIWVLDEADRMLDMGFIEPIRRIGSAIPGHPQTLLFSATMPPEIVKLAESLLRQPVRVAVSPVSSAAHKIDQSVVMVARARKPDLLEHFLRDPEVARALVFTRTKHGAERLMRRLRKNGVSADAIHGNKAQNQRERALDGFRSGRARVLVATDVAARGLDVDQITHVFNFDLPVEPEAYVHRIGRTGRAGAQGVAVAFCDGEERSLLREIETLMKKKIPVAQAPEGFADSAPAAETTTASAGGAHGHRHRGPKRSFGFHGGPRRGRGRSW